MADQEKVDFDTLMRCNLSRVFGERDHGRRRAALDELYATDATLYDPEGVFTGRDAINGVVEAIIALLPPEFVLTPVGSAVGHHGLGRLTWRAGPPGGPAAVTGTDVAKVEGGPDQVTARLSRPRTALSVLVEPSRPAWTTLSRHASNPEILPRVRLLNTATNGQDRSGHTGRKDNRVAIARPGVVCPILGHRMRTASLPNSGQAPECGL